MANKTSWVAGAGQGLSYGSAGFTAADFNSLATANCVVASSAIANNSSLDLYSDVSFVATVGGTTLVTSRLDLYILPLNQDGTTYGDGTASGSAVPSASYQVASVGVKSGITTGNAVTGTFRGIVMPPGSFKFVVANQLGIALNSSAAVTMSYRTYNENLNA